MPCHRVFALFYVCLFKKKRKKSPCLRMIDTWFHAHMSILYATQVRMGSSPGAGGDEEARRKHRVGSLMSKFSFSRKAATSPSREPHN